LFWKEKSRVYHGGDTAMFIYYPRPNVAIITKTNQIADHVGDYFKTLFCTNPLLQDQLLVDEVIPSLVSDNVNNLLTMSSSKSEIKNVVFDINKDGVSESGGSI
jgi:hypothetical protein